MPRTIKHINHALVAELHTPLYLMHTYWARKPHNVVAEYIKHYSQAGDIVLDPFMGSGVTLVESLKADRKAVGIDINPVAAFIAEMTARPVDLNAYQEAFNRVSAEVQEPVSVLFRTKCPRCGKHREVQYVVRKEDEPVRIRYDCPACAPRRATYVTKHPDDEDRQRLKQIERMPIPAWYPDNRLYYPDGSPFMKKEHVERLSDLFTRRSLIALSLIWQSIQALPDGPARDLMKFTFSCGVHLASIMNPDVPGKWGPEWSIPSYWIPDTHREYNTWYIFETRFHKVLKGKTPSPTNELPRQFLPATEFAQLASGRPNALLVCEDALTALRRLPDSCVDYVFTDPAYGGSIQYGELSFLWAAWLGFDTTYLRTLQADEVIINTEGQHKGFDEYYNMLYVIFQEVGRVLKPHAYMTVTFHNPKFAIRNALERACYVAGFDLEEVVFQPPPKIPTKKASMQPYGSVTGDFYFRFRNAKKPGRAIQQDDATFRRIVIEAATRVIAERGEPTPMPIISNGIEPELCQHGFPFSSAHTAEDVIVSQINTHFIVLDKSGQPVPKPDNISDKSLWLVHPDRYLLDKVPLKERIEKTVVGILLRRRKVTFTDVMVELYTSFQNALTPNPTSVTALLEQYAERVSDGSWQVKQIVQQREGEHAKMIGVLAELGKKALYNVWIGAREQSALFESEPLARRCTLPRPLALPGIPSQAARRIEQIDVLWVSEGRIVAAFEVENTTTITEGIVRASNIPYPVEHFCVLPSERENLLYHKLREPMIADRVRAGTWRFIFYDDLTRFSNEHRRGATLDELRQVAKRPRLRTDRQLTVPGFAPDPTSAL